MHRLVSDSCAVLCLVYHHQRSRSMSCADSPTSNAWGGVCVIPLSQQSWLVSSRNLLQLVKRAGKTWKIHSEKVFSNVLLFQCALSEHSRC